MPENQTICILTITGFSLFAGSPCGYQRYEVRITSNITFTFDANS